MNSNDGCGSLLVTAFLIGLAVWYFSSSEDKAVCRPEAHWLDSWTGADKKPTCADMIADLDSRLSALQERVDSMTDGQ